MIIRNAALREIGYFQLQTLTSGPPWKENCYLIRHLPSGEQALVDPGGDAGPIVETVRSGGLNLRYIWLTHAHHDHLGAVAELGRQFGTICDLHKSDVRLLHHAPMYALRFAHQEIEVPESFRAFDGNVSFEFGGQTVTAIHVPGHSQGSVCYAFDDFVFTGDTILYKHVGRTDLPGSNASMLKASITMLLETLPGDNFIFPGHGRAWSVTDARDWWHGVLENPPALDAFEVA